MKSAGRMLATCWQIVDCGVQTWHLDDDHRRTVREIIVGFELWDIAEGRQRPRSIEQRYNLSFWRTAKLHRHLCHWLGRPLTLAEREAFDFRQLIGKSATLHTTTAPDGRWIRIDDVRPGPYDRPPHRPSVYLMLQDFEPEQWERVNPKHRDRIMRSPTYLALFERAADFPADYVRPATGRELLDGDEIPW